MQVKCFLVLFYIAILSLVLHSISAVFSLLSSTFPELFFLLSFYVNTL